MLGTRSLTCILFLAACTGGEEGTDTGSDHARLRVSTHADLVSMAPWIGSTFSANLGELVFVLGSQYFDRADLNGDSVIFTPKAGTNVDVNTLAGSLRARGLVSATAQGPRVVAHFESAELAAEAVELEQPLLELGPYRQESFTPGDEENRPRLVLKQRQPSDGFDTIDVVAYASQEEEWRHFFGGEVDLMSHITPAYAPYLHEIPSIRMVPFTGATPVGIFFAIGSPAVNSVEVRRALSMTIRRKALAEYATGDMNNAARAPEDLAEARRLLASRGIDRAHPLRLRLAVVDSATDIQRTGLVLEQQLTLVGVEVEFKLLPPAESWTELAEGRADAVIALGASWEDPRTWELFTSPTYGTGYDSAEFRAAFAAKDLGAMRSIIERDVPSTPLYTLRTLVALDANLCGARPEGLGVYLWLKDVHRCAPDERP